MTYIPADPPAARFGRLLIGMVVLGVAVLTGYFVVPDIIPSVRAAQGHGTPGWFVATRLDCGKRCLWHGEFRPDSGGSVRRDVWIEGADKDDLRVGGSARAVDAGARSNVYMPDGSVHWLGIAGGSALVVMFAGAGCVLLWRARPMS